MGAQNDAEKVNQCALRLIRCKARQVAGRYGFSKSDIEDLEQEFWLDLLQRRSSYDSGRSQLNTFTNRIITHRIANMKETQEAAKRDYRLCAGSLDEEIEDEDGDTTSLHESVDANDCFKRAGWSGHSSEDQIGLKLDVDKIISSLPPELRETCERLKIPTVSEISEVMGISRSSVYRKIEQIRKILEAGGIREYLQHGRDTLARFPVGNR